MKIKTIIDKEDGTYEFQAVLTTEQHSFLIEYAVRDLMMKGLLPFVTAGQPNGDVTVLVPTYDPATPKV